VLGSSCQTSRAGYCAEITTFPEFGRRARTEILKSLELKEKMAVRDEQTESKSQAPGPS
jgi:hypothetical protein